tara:strand:- start:378 stop:551 length:174 start_codon:yes stop_codon:yes gene_type:complete
MKNLSLLEGKELAQLLNQLDAQGREDEAIIVEAEMDFRYEVGFKNELLTNNNWFHKL